ncbi:hypothetical protein Salat_2142700 [Sesamum alatum]|uniref:Reverse transcriptase RNase H-like domain-containing protein n=1 Tax=Sesamum alatum TaxID=300844 RepID=A0AAE1Y1F7_9LAMI|nr:hypothetical protein Salat_2142700 [Sesamum alatum]
MCPSMQTSSTYVRELFAITEAVKKWRHYLLGHTFCIFTDHRSLKELVAQTIQTSEQQQLVAQTIQTCVTFIATIQLDSPSFRSSNLTLTCSKRFLNKVGCSSSSNACSFLKPQDFVSAHATTGLVDKALLEGWENDNPNEAQNRPRRDRRRPARFS